MAFDAVEVAVASERHKVVDGEWRFVAVELNHDRAFIGDDLGRVLRIAVDAHRWSTIETLLLVSRAINRRAINCRLSCCCRVIG